MNTEAPCPCHSKKTYTDCCQRYHLGKKLPHPEALMRSRYSAYALGLVEYILNTTHPDHPLWKENRAKVKKGIVDFGANTQFEGLTILSSAEPKEKEAYVSFHAILKQGDEDTSFIENSLFLKENGRWLYHSAINDKGT